MGLAMERLWRAVVGQLTPDAVRMAMSFGTRPSCGGLLGAGVTTRVKSFTRHAEPAKSHATPGRIGSSLAGPWKHPRLVWTLGEILRAGGGAGEPSYGAVTDVVEARSKAPIRCSAQCS